METCKIEYTCNTRINKKLRINRVLVKAFTNYVYAMSRFLFTDPDCNCRSDNKAMGILMHK